MTSPVTTPAALDASVLACHDLLVRLAGRLPDELLWRLRDWLAADAYAALGRILPRSLLRHRVGLTDGEQAMLRASVGQWGARQRLIDAVLPLAAPEEPDVDFDPLTDSSAGQDLVDLVVVAVARGHAGTVEVRRTWRLDAQRAQRVVLAHCTERQPALTGTLQRVLRAHGDRTPCVEVLSPNLGLPAYHRLALLASTPLWQVNHTRNAAPVPS
ncbi:MAG: hypothetical protein JWR88_1450 [Pseudonocardia sp.]|jgi:hypothetical protein|nr:hypothetical protein [Pseudonocardia sp.]